jgi:thiamine-monophosphate kinase
MPAGLGEFDRISRFFKPLAAGIEGALELQDDAALISPPSGEELAVTTDAMVEGVHYLAGEDPARLARKLLRVNLSDLAAMGARPVAYTLTTVLPKSVGDDWLARLAAGLASDQEAFGLHLIGGDSVSTTGPVVLSVTALGAVPKGRALTRSGARPGDRVFVSGTLGDGALGLMAAKGELPHLSPGDVEALSSRYHLPTPRTGLGPRLLQLASACMDVSDGLPGDLAHICEASGVGARVEVERLPLSEAARRAIDADRSLLSTALSGGDDYELLFTAPPAAMEAIGGIAAELGIPLTPIGEIVEGDGVALVDRDGRPIENLHGWTHF